MSDSWLGLAVVVVIGVIIVGFAICTGKVIIWLFDTEPEEMSAADVSKPKIKSAYHEAA
jgi:hypothetical protein